MSARNRTERILAVMGAVALVVMATDALTYAATGSSLILGRTNRASTVTVIENTVTRGVPLELRTKSAVTPPLRTNGRGKVANFYADRAATADNATKFAGKTPSQWRSGVGRKPARIRWVAPSGGDFTSVSAALASITTNDSSHPFLIMVSPGTFVEQAPLVMKSWVDIEGSGTDLTVIVCSCSSARSPLLDNQSAVIDIDGPSVHTALRNLTIANTASVGSYATGVRVVDTASRDVTFDHVRISSVGGTVAAYGMYFQNAYADLDHMDIVAVDLGGPQAVGIRSSSIGGSAITLDDSDVVASTAGGFGDGLSVANATITVRTSRIRGGSHSILAAGLQPKLVMGSLLSGAATGGGLVCSATLNGVTRLALDATCA